MSERNRMRMSRRQFLSSAAVALTVAGTSGAFARAISNQLPWAPATADPPVPIQPGGWHFFSPREGATLEALVDRLVPADDLSMGGREAGCATYIDRQMLTSFGTSSRLYTKGPFEKALPTQGYQGSQNPAERYRAGLAAIDKFLQGRDKKNFTDLAPDQQDAFLTDLEAGKIELPDGVDAKGFFGLLLQNTMEGFFGDPVYGGNKDMVSWKMIGFPGARYDYRDFVSRHNETYPNPPVSIMGRPEWSAQNAQKKG